jgi:hypothetical protein
MNQLFYSDPLSEIVFKMLTLIAIPIVKYPILADTSIDAICLCNFNNNITVNDIGVSSIDDHLTYGIEI